MIFSVDHVFWNLFLKTVYKLKNKKPFFTIFYKSYFWDSFLFFTFN